MSSFLSDQYLLTSILSLHGCADEDNSVARFRSKFGAREDNCTIGEHRTIRRENPMKLHLRATILVMYDFQSTHVQTCHISVRTKNFHSMLTSITCSARYPNNGEKQWGRAPRVEPDHEFEAAHSTVSFSKASRGRVLRLRYRKNTRTSHLAATTESAPAHNVFLDSISRPLLGSCTVLGV